MIQEATANQLVGGPGENDSACRHTLYHANARGVLQGTWQAVDVRRSQRIECRVCGKFYGYRKRARTDSRPR